MTSYHDKIQEVARAIEEERAKIYQEDIEYVYSKKQLMFLRAVLYKTGRLEIAKNKEKVLDDIIDAYNYLALLYRDMTKE